MKENKKLETRNTGVVAGTPSVQIIDNRKEITEITETELKELKEIAKQYGRDSWKYSEYLKKNFKHIGKEIPENIPFSEYHDYILT